MTAPDPGLTDLIAAHYRHCVSEEIRLDPETGVHTYWIECTCVCGADTSVEVTGDREAAVRLADAAHLALELEQHTNGRIAELEATIARVREGAQMLIESFQWVERGGNRLYDSATHRCADNLALLLAEAQGPEHLRAALEGEQQ